jgi:hypothetical protein
MVDYKSSIALAVIFRLNSLFISFIALGNAWVPGTNFTFIKFLYRKILYKHKDFRPKYHIIAGLDNS